MYRLLLKSVMLLPAVMVFSMGMAGAQPYFNGIGMAAFQAATTNLYGSGMRVAIVEAPEDGNTNFEAIPGYVGQPVSLFTYYSSAGSDTNFPNSVGGGSGHATSTADVICSPVFDGLATNIAHMDNIEANYFIDSYLSAPLQPGFGDVVMNLSYTHGALPVAVQQSADTLYDNYSVRNNTLFAAAVGDGGNVAAPGTAYNCIGVAAYYPPGASSSIGPTIDNSRCKPDITAINVYGSFSTPQVAGAATLLMQAGLRGDGGSNTNFATDMRTIKALLLNGAVKPSDWTNSHSAPLDARYGAGVLNVLNSYAQLAGGRQTNFSPSATSLTGAHPPLGASNTIGNLTGWNFATNTSSTSSNVIHHYYFNVSNGVPAAKFTATATLVWNRHLNTTGINDLDLYLYNCANSNLVAWSTSRVDNVEHICQTNLAQGRYDLQVWKAGGVTVTTDEAYALAFEFMPPPPINIAGPGANVALTWPLYPAGFLVEARTNLLSGAWGTNGLPAAVITNGLNSIPLNTTNPLQFFRLRRPNL